MSQISKQTPGPWVARFDRDELGADVEDMNGVRVCNCGPEDATIIAAAPYLFSALRAVTARLELLADQIERMTDKPTLWRDEILAANSAIAKAEGR